MEGFGRPSLKVRDQTSNAYGALLCFSAHSSQLIKTMAAEHDTYAYEHATHRIQR